MPPIAKGTAFRGRRWAALAAAVLAIGAGALWLRPVRYSGRPADLRVVADTEDQQRRGFVEEVRQRLRRGAYEELDQLAHELRSTKARFANGSWKLAAFYKAFSADCSQECGTDEGAALRATLRATQEWVDRRPGSAAAKIALAEVLFGEAWELRGGGYGNTVSDQTWELVDQRVQRAQGILAAAGPPAERGPGWWSTQLHLALFQSLDRAAFDTLFDQAVALEPEYDTFYSWRGYYLLPRQE